MTQPPESPRTQRDVDAFSKSIVTGVVLSICGLVPAAAAVLVAFNLGFGHNFLLAVLFGALALAMITSGWTVFVHGDLKQRSDTAAAIAIALLLLALMAVASELYRDDWLIVLACPIDPAYHPDCTSNELMEKHRLNASSLNQIVAVFGIGQIVPLLSIIKDIVYSHLRPTPWQEVIQDREVRRTIRRTNRQRRIRHDELSVPDDSAGIGSSRTLSTIVVTAIVTASLVLNFRRRQH